MAKTPTAELFSTLKGYFGQLSGGERTAGEVASALNDWARESAESVRAKIADEVEVAVSKMGFVKREEYELLLSRIEKMERALKSKKSPEERKKKSAKSSPKSSPKSSTEKKIKKNTKKASK
jgi:BMFP domain-containing protein YqiC